MSRSSLPNPSVDSTHPRAIIHRQILDAAAAIPEASIDELADCVTGAIIDLVERVLETYGDPAGDESTTTGDGAPASPTDPSTTTAEPDDGTAEAAEEPTGDSDIPNKTASEDADADSSPPDTDTPELSPTQLKTLRLVADRQDATQAEIADELGVIAGTVSNQLNAIDGFDWAERDRCAPQLLSDQTDHTSQPPMSTADTDLSSIENRLDDLEATLTDQVPARPVFDDPTLLHKVLHACMQAEDITEDEERQIIATLVGSGSSIE